jgi:error-prone DNA polymerase
MFGELHAQSAFSFLEGAEQPEALVAEAARLDMGVLALVDRDSLAGAPRFYQAALRAGIRPLIGSELTLRDGTRLPLLVEDREGYQNLSRLITLMKLRAPKGEGALDLDEIAPYSTGLVCLTGGTHGPLARLVAAGDARAARAALDRLVGIFGADNCWVEVQRHLDRGEERVLQRLVRLARDARLSFVGTNQPLYCGERGAIVDDGAPWSSGRALADVLTCIREKTTLDAAGHLLAVNDERRLKPGVEMARLFADLPEAVTNTGELALRLAFTLKDVGYRFPDFPLPPGQTPHEYLRALAERGARQRYGQGSLAGKARRQIAHELEIIGRLDLAGYFLIVWDIVEYCHRQNILVQGRGSAANSAVCYALGITAVDPVKMELLFERFLSEARGEWPDIDLDLPSGDRREEVIQHVYRQYGRLGAAMTANVITYRGRSAAREVGKALGLPEDLRERLSKLVPNWGYRDPADVLTRHLAAAGCDPAHPRIRAFAALWTRIQDLPRHLGQHSGGMVIAAGRLDDIVPLEPATMPGRVVIQWDKEDCAALGIIKVDLLGLRMMSVIQEAIQIVGETGGEIDLAHLPADDETVYGMLREADTIGVFQVESRAQMATLPRIQPERFYDLVVQVAIIRPGPIVGDMVHPYINRRRGREPITYPHPSLKPILERTLGVPLFQEQLLRMAMATAGFTGTQAEELRRAFGFKRSEARMKEVEAKLRTGMARQGIEGDAAEQIVHAITAFALYGFPESHASSFALLAYASAYLKAHHPAAFYAALLNNQPMGFYHPATIVKDAQRHGQRILPVDVRQSEWLCTVEPWSRDAATRGEGERPLRQRDLDQRGVPPTGTFAVRLGLRYVKGLRESAAKALVAARAERPFASPIDVAHRVPLDRAERETLASIGAFASLGGTRRQNMWAMARSPGGPLFATVETREGMSCRGDDEAGQERRSRSPAGSADERSPLREMTQIERLEADYGGTSVTVGRHPMAFRRADLAARGVRRACDLARASPGQRIRVAGSVIVRQRPGTAKGFVFLSLEDETGIANVIVTPQLFERHRLVLVTEPILIVEGVLQKQDGVVSIKAGRVQELPRLAHNVPSHDFG